LITHTIILFILAVENLDTWIEVMIMSSLLTAIWTYLPALSPNQEINIIIDSIVFIMSLFTSMDLSALLSDSASLSPPDPSFPIQESIGDRHLQQLL